MATPSLFVGHRQRRTSSRRPPSASALRQPRTPIRRCPSAGGLAAARNTRGTISRSDTYVCTCQPPAIPIGSPLAPVSSSLIRDRSSPTPHSHTTPPPSSELSPKWRGNSQAAASLCLSRFVALLLQPSTRPYDAGQRITCSQRLGTALLPYSDTTYARPS